MTYNGGKYWENVGHGVVGRGSESKKQESTVENSIVSKTWKAKMQDMSREAEEMKAKCRNPGSKEPCRIYEL